MDATDTKTAETAGEARREAEARIAYYQKQGSRGIWALALFLMITVAAVRNFEFLPSLPESVHMAMGKPPSPLMISGLLVIYSFAAIILILSRMTGGTGHYSGFSHVGYLSGFYLFYHFGHALEENVLAVFAAGMTILILESYHIWTFSTERIKQEREALQNLERLHRWQGRDNG